jgi:hypothetical protein
MGFHPVDMIGFEEAIWPDTLVVNPLVVISITCVPSKCLRANLNSLFLSTLWRRLITC